MSNPRTELTTPESRCILGRVTTAGLTSHCLNCGTELRGRFCSTCGQRSAPPFPTLREMIADAWHELTVFDSRLARTVWTLLRQPGRLTLEYLSGRRVAYIPPLRLYLVASVIYFLVAAMVPTVVVTRRTATLPGKENITLDILAPRELTPDERAEAEQAIARAPGVIRPMLHRAFFDTETLRTNMIAALPKMLFVLVPVFAAIVAIFYWRPFSQHLVFALYLHAAVFMALGIRKLSNVTRSTVVVGIFELVAVVFLAVYSQFSFRKVYGDSWPRVLGKSLGIGGLYAIAVSMGLVAAFAWAALVD